MNKRLELREKSLKQQPETDKGHDRSLKEASVASEFTAGSAVPNFLQVPENMLKVNAVFRGYSGDAAQEELQKIMDYKATADTSSILGYHCFNFGGNAGSSASNQRCHRPGLRFKVRGIEYPCERASFTLCSV